MLDHKRTEGIDKQKPQAGEHWPEVRQSPSLDPHLRSLSDDMLLLAQVKCVADSWMKQPRVNRKQGEEKEATVNPSK